MNTIFYEIEHGSGINHFLFEKNTDHAFPPHMHRCYEMVLMLDGEMRMRVDNADYLLHAGDLILVKPNRIHSYHTDPGMHGTCLLCVFSGDLIAAIHETISQYRLRSIVLHDVPTLYRDVFALMGERKDTTSIKGFLYLSCALFQEQVEYGTPDEFSGDTAPLHRMFVYIESNVDQPCTLHELAAELKYNESYLSRIFTKYVGVPYSDYVRNIKINYACYLLQNTDISIYQIAMRCGYSTQSSFNRSFKQVMQCKPNEYKKRATSVRGNTDTP